MFTISKAIQILMFIAVFISHSAFAETHLTCESSNSTIPKEYFFSILITGAGQSANLHISAPRSVGDFKYDAVLSTYVGQLGNDVPSGSIAVFGKATVTYSNAPAATVDGMYFVQSQILDGKPGLLTVITGSSLAYVKYECR